MSTTNDDSRQDTLEEAFCEYLQGIDAGEAIDKEAFLSRYPEIAGTLAEHLAADSVVRQFAGPTFAETQTDLQGTFILPSKEPAAIDETVISSPSMETQCDKELANWGIPQEFGRYRVKKLLGQGAMGAVYLAHDTQLDRPVALKIPKFDKQQDKEVLERFYREARAVATLHHPNICPVYDVGEIEGQTFLSMAYIEGRPLSDFAKSSKKQAERSAAKLVMKLALALQEAHEIGVVHRDLKPANIMVGKKGEPVVMDFGLARRLDSNDTRVTQSGTIVGTPAYMSPEQVEGNPDAIGPQSDQYSLGVILYELLTGRLPFHGSVLSVIGQIAHVEPQSIDKLRADVDPRLVAICKKMMAKKRQDRYENLAAVASAINAYLVESKTGASPENQSLWDQTKAATPKQKTTEPTRRAPQKSLPAKPRAKGQKKGRKPRKRKPLAMILIAATITLLLAAGIFYFQTAEGTVRIEINDPEVQVTFQDQTFTIDDNGTPIEVKPGKHKLLVKRGGLEVPTEEFTVSKNGDVAIQVTWLDGELKVQRDGETIGSKRLPAAERTPQTTVASAEDYALEFDGEDDFVEFPTLVYRGTHPITAEAYVTLLPPKPLSQDNPVCFLHFPWQLGFMLNDGQKFLQAVHPRRDSWKWSAKSPVVSGKRMHVALVRDPKLLSLYVNGHVVGEINEPMEEDLQISLALRLGAGIGKPYCFHGTIDEVRISKTARYTKDFDPPARFEPDGQTMALYHFDEGKGDVLKDASGNGHDGKIVGAKWISQRANSETEPTPPNNEITLVRKFEGHKNRICDVAVSPNGRYIVSGTPATDGENEHYPLRVWELSSGKELDGFDFVKQGAAGLAFSPSGQRFAVSVLDESRNYEVILYDFESRRQVHTLKGHTDFAQIAAFSPNGRFLFTAGRDATIRMWDAETGKALHVIEAGTPIQALAISPDGRHLLFAGAKNQLVVWDIETRQESRRIDLPRGGAYTLAIASDGQTVCGGTGLDGDVLVCDLEAGTVRRMWKAHGGIVAGVEFTPDGRHIITAGHDRTIKIWNAETLALVASHEADSYCTNFLDITPDGRHIVTGGGHSVDRAANKNVNDGDYALRLWQLPESVWPKESPVAANEPITQDRKLDESHPSMVRAIAVTPDGRQVLSGGHSVLLHDLKTGKLLHAFDGPSEVFSAAISPDGQYAVTGHRSSLRIHNLKTRALIGELDAHTKAIFRVAISPDSKLLLSASMDGTAAVWDLEARKELSRIETGYSIWGAAFHSDDTIILAGFREGGVCELWDWKTKSQMRSWKVPGLIKTLTLSPDGKSILIAGHGGLLRLVNLESGLSRDFSGHKGIVNAVQFLPDGRHFLSGSDEGTLFAWSLESGSVVASYRNPNRIFNVLSLTPDGRSVVAGGGYYGHEGIDQATGDYAIRVWKLPKSVWPDVPFAWGVTASILTSDEYEWTTPKNLGPRINSPKGDGVPWVSEDELTLIFASNRPVAEGSNVAYELWQCTRSSVEEDWSEPVNLGDQINSKWFDGQGVISPDGRTMIIVSARPPSQGEMDLWMATRESITSPWREPVNLGETVNSPGVDHTPYLSDNGLRLVFNSNRDGRFRLYVTTRKSLDGGWSTPALFSGIGGQGGAVQLLDSETTLLYDTTGVAIFLAGWDAGEQRWKHDVLLPAPINDRHSKTGKGFFCRSTNTLYFESDRPGGQGETDLWMSRRVKKQKAESKK